MELIYTGPRGQVLPLQEGWPAASHLEPDEAVAKAKLASGQYQPVSKAKPKEEDVDGDRN